MEKVKRFFSCFLVIFIVINYLLPFVHVFEHVNDTFTAISINELQYKLNANIKKQCCFCDIYFNLDYSQFQSLTYSLIVFKCIPKPILGEEKIIRHIVLFQKKSRAPPTHII